MCQGFVVYLAWLLLINVRIHDLITSQLCCKLHYRLRKTMMWLYSDLNSQPYIFVTKEWNGISYPEAYSTEGALARVCQNSYSCNTNFCNALISVANDVLCIINLSLKTILILNNFSVDLFHKIICSLWNTIFNNVCTIKRPSFLQYDQWVGVKDTAVWCGGCGCLHQRPTGRGQQTSHSGPRTPSDISRAVITTNGKEIHSV